MAFNLRNFVFFGVMAFLLCLSGQRSIAEPLSLPGDTVRRFEPRLVLILTDTSEKGRLQRTQLFYDQLKNKFYRRDLTRRLFDFLIVSPTQKSRRSPLSEEAVEYFQQFEGKRIQQISIHKLPLFGPTVNDTTKRPTNWWQRLGNAAHFQTRDWVISKNLLFKEGETVNPELFYDNERLLRRLSYIRDARIILVPLSDSPDEVAVQIVTQDVFPLSIDVGRGHFSSYSLAIQNNNIFGVGHRLTSEALYRRDGSPVLGYGGAYMVENVNGTFINASINGSYTDVRRGGGFSLQRPFFTPDIRWAGGLEVQRIEQINVVLHRNPALDTLVWYGNDNFDLWLGHAVPLNNRSSYMKGRESLVLGARGIRVFYHETPGGELQRNDFFLDRKLLLGSIGWVRRQYRRDALIYGFGRTEDVPLGASFNATYGVEHQQEIMYYGQLSGAWGSFSEKAGYLDFRAAVGQYFGVGEGASRRVRYGEFSWISPLLAKRSYKFRQLLMLNYLYGDKRYSYEFIGVGDQEIRGLRGVHLRGTQRFNISVETIAFTPVQFVGFRLAGFVFADVAMLNNRPYLSMKGELLQGYGLGVRVRNENLVFKTFQLRFSYYPNPGRGFGVTLQGSPSSVFQDFLVGRPEVYPFR